MNARFYVPDVGRFASADNIVPDPMNLQSFNRYSYVLNSPTNLVDPTGHCATTELPDGSFMRDSNDDACWQAYDEFAEFMSPMPDWYLEYYGWNTQKWYKAERYSQEQLEYLLETHQTQSRLPRACNGRGGNCATAKWHQAKNTFVDWLVPDYHEADAIALGFAASSDLVVLGGSGGYELVLNSRSSEISLFSLAGGGGTLGAGGNAAIYAAAVHELPNNAAYEGVFIVDDTTVSIAQYGFVRGTFKAAPGETYGSYLGYAPGANVSRSRNFIYYPPALVTFNWQTNQLTIGVQQ